MFCFALAAFGVGAVAQAQGYPTLANVMGVVVVLGICLYIVLFARASLREGRAEEGALDAVSIGDWMQRLSDPATARARRTSTALFLLSIPLFFIEIVAQRLGYFRVASVAAAIAFAAILAALGVIVRGVFRVHRGDG